MDNKHKVEYCSTDPGNKKDQTVTKKSKGKRSTPVVSQLRTQKHKSALLGCALSDPYEKGQMSRLLVNKGTGVVFHMKMGDHECLWDFGYPECPARFFCILQRCAALGLLDRCISVAARQVTVSELKRVHSQYHIDSLEKYDGYSSEIVLEDTSSLYDAIYIHPATHQAALLAAGSCISLVDAICSNEVSNGMAIVRPPGHHAMESEFNGYCFFNNVAVAAEHALEIYKFQRILVVDWDVHHGQGTQRIFYKDPRVLYFSIHRYENGSFWPYLAESDLTSVGEGHGEGFNLNVPLNVTGLGDEEYMAIFQQLLLPMAYEYEPDLVLVSAGYDAATGCPEGEMNVTPACYAHLLWSLKGLAQGKIAVILEGGYCLKSLAEGAALTLRSLLGDPCPPLPPLKAPHQVVKETILRCVGQLTKYWKCFVQLHKVGFVDNRDVQEAPVWPYPGALRLVANNPPFSTRSCYPLQDAKLKARIDQSLNDLIRETTLTFPSNRVCFSYDSGMEKYFDKTPGLELESPDRLMKTHMLLTEFGILKRCNILKVMPANPSLITLVHDEEYVSFLSKSEHLELTELKKLQAKYHSVILHPNSFSAVLLAVGSLLQVVDEVCSGQSMSGVALIRPPGHHAEVNHPCGFCLVNNVAIAVKHAQIKFGLKRVLIVDWDVHHGNGTQHIFYEDPSVLYLSIHRYENGTFFPFSPDAACDKTGSGAGIGYNLNIGWNKHGMGDGDYMAAFSQVVMPVAYEFSPELVIISAGFDAAVNDPLGRCKVTPEAYGHLTHWLSSLANGKIVLSLEGGYNVHSVSMCMAMSMKALLDDPLTPLEHLSPSLEGMQAIYETTLVHTKFWKSLGIKNSGANTRQVIKGMHSTSSKLFGKLYEELTIEEQLACYYDFLPSSRDDVEGRVEPTRIIEDFVKLGLEN